MAQPHRHWHLVSRYLRPAFEALDPVLEEGPPLKRPPEKLAAAQVEGLLAGLR
jgi:hypothetical protein